MMHSILFCLSYSCVCLREASNPTPHRCPQCNWGRCHALIPCAMGDLSETQVAMVVRCSSGVHRSVGHRWCQCCSLIRPDHSHPPKLSILQACTFFCVCVVVFVTAAVHVCCVFNMNRQPRRKDETMWCGTI